jgi:GNAT superfamily N-acetyltransferase
MTLDNFTLKYGKSLSGEELEYVENGFSTLAFLAKKLPPIESFCINLYDKEKFISTVFGSIYYGCMYIDTLFVDENYRNKKLGKELMQKAEDLARERSCNFITLTTMDWEARGFYEKLGYEFEYERTGYMNGAVLYCLRKNL